jgi:hypothetical protein
MRFFVAKDAPQNDGGFLAVCEFGRRFALEKLWRGRLWKSGAEPPHSTLGRASLQTGTLRDRVWCGRRASRLGARWFSLAKLALGLDENPHPSQLRRRMGHPERLLQLRSATVHGSPEGNRYVKPPGTRFALDANFN